VATLKLYFRVARPQELHPAGDSIRGGNAHRVRRPKAVHKGGYLVVHLKKVLFGGAKGVFPTKAQNQMRILGTDVLN
jgi:hypothetical protein